MARRSRGGGGRPDRGNGRRRATPGADRRGSAGKPRRWRPGNDVRLRGGHRHRRATGDQHAVARPAGSRGRRARERRVPRIVRRGADGVVQEARLDPARQRRRRTGGPARGADPVRDRVHARAPGRGAHRAGRRAAGSRRAGYGHSVPRRNPRRQRRRRQFGGDRHRAPSVAGVPRRADAGADRCCLAGGAPCAARSDRGRRGQRRRPGSARRRGWQRGTRRPPAGVGRIRRPAARPHTVRPFAGSPRRGAAPRARAFPERRRRRAGPVGRLLSRRRHRPAPPHRAAGPAPRFRAAPRSGRGAARRRCIGERRGGCRELRCGRLSASARVTSRGRRVASCPGPPPGEQCRHRVSFLPHVAVGGGPRRRRS